MKSKIRTVLIIFILICSGLTGLVFSLYHHKNPLKPNVHYPVSFVTQLANDPHAGEKIFKAFCVNCHGAQPIIDTNAPRIGDHQAWQFRYQLGMTKLLQLTINGVGIMPARGGCFECDDEMLRQTIQFILKQSNVLPK